MYYKIEQIKNILANHKNCVFSLDHLCSSALEYIQHLETGIDRCYKMAEEVRAHIKNARGHSERIDCIIQQIESAQPKWISVEERLPEKGQKVLVCGVKNGMQVGAFRGIPAPSRSRLWWWKKNTLLEVTHWMPLPEAPKEG